MSTLQTYWVARTFNNLLVQYEEIERKNFKLWLTSSAVLERVLHAGIFADSEAHLERIRLRLCRYVPNRSFDRAQAILEKTSASSPGFPE